MAHMAFLPARVAAPRDFGRARRCSGRIGRWRFRGVVRMLTKAGFKLGNALLKCGGRVLELGNLLLLEVDSEQAGADEGAHRGRRGGPIAVRDSCWWRIGIHSQSIPALTQAVNHPCGASSTMS